MGKMKMNPEKFAPVPAQKAEISSHNMQDNAVFEPTLVESGNSYPVYADQGGNNIQIKTDMVSNIIGDICGVVNEISRTIGMIRVEEEKTRQVKAVANARIRIAEEQTKQVMIQESAATERIKAQYLMELKKAEMNLQKELAVIQNEREKLLSDERKFELALKKLEQYGQELINMNKVYLSRNPESNFEFIYKINEQLLILADKIAQLYHESRK